MKSSNKKKYDYKGAELLVLGIVQGVGFRPFIYNLAIRLDVSGTVSNTSVGVCIKAYGTDDNLETFIGLIEIEAPPLARILSIEQRPLLDECSVDSFTILKSTTSSKATTILPPDIALCPDCLQELLDPKDRRFNYPFINCTNCGPRYTIIDSIPYDRPKTSMKDFPMCPSCEEEYNDPSNRRFHAQPNACPDCGPHLIWPHGNDSALSGNPIKACIDALADGKIVAIRGLGGFHLCVDATSEKAVGLLRNRKSRPFKPLAIMVADIHRARDFCHINKDEEDKLLSPEHPIILLPKKQNQVLASNLAPSIGDIGVMLPYTPLHHILFVDDKCPEALVMTSGNSSGVPICTGNSQAMAELDNIADYFLLHNRDILTRLDDSVVKCMQGDFRTLRRARGYTPLPLVLPYQLPPILASGAGFKNTLCMARDNYAFSSQHIGDLYSIKTFNFYTESIEHMKKVFEMEPEVVACDLHPDYLSSHYARGLGLPLYPIQHHHAHAVSVMAENHLDETVLAIILDGTGYGTDGTIWGGEILLASLTHFERLGHLEQLALPGGDIASNEPWRMGLSALHHSFDSSALDYHRLPPLLQTVTANQRQIVATMLESNFNSPLTSSCGRLFDAMAALLDIQLNSHFEGQAAMKLEALAKKAMTLNWREALLAQAENFNMPFRKKNGNWEILTSRFVKILMRKLNEKSSKSHLALQFHFELITSMSAFIRHLAELTGIRTIVLSGGCMQNQILLEGFYHVLQENGFKVFTGKEIPINDGGISLGQAIIGGLQHVSRNTHAGDSSTR